MNKPFHSQPAISRHAQVTLGSLLVLVILGLNASGAFAESLFRASATYQADSAYTPHSLFTRPSSGQVGDMVTIVVDETSTLDSSAELKITRDQTIDQNGSGMFNTMLRFMLDKVNAGGLADKLSAPSITGMDNSTNLTSKAESSRETTLKDSITCQVVQVLPNGYLVVQGQKTVAINKERQDIILTGIVNPYYLNRNNEINSSQVANMQLLQGGKGVISRQQNDGIAHKIYQFFN